MSAHNGAYYFHIYYFVLKSTIKADYVVAWKRVIKDPRWKLRPFQTSFQTL